MLANLPVTLLNTILTRLTPLFLPGAPGDATAARDAARQFLSTYNPRNAQELRLAAQIISFSLHALAALEQAADPDLPLTRIMRLRGSAISLNRESEKAQRRLDQCQQTSHAEPVQTEPAVTEVEASPTLPQAVPAVSTNQTWTQDDQQKTDERIAASLQRAADRVAAMAAAERPLAAPSRP
jgi:hypothetical protein